MFPGFFCVNYKAAGKVRSPMIIYKYYKTLQLDSDTLTTNQEKIMSKFIKYDSK